MREILFKAKRLDNGEWISGSLVCFAGGARAILPSDSKTLFQKAKALFAAIPVMMLTPPRSASTPA